MEWKEMEKMTVLKLRDEALKFPQIESVHSKNKEQLMHELADILVIERPHVRFAEKIVQTKSELKHRIHELKNQRNQLAEVHDHKTLHAVRREMHQLKHAIRKIEAGAANT